MIRLEGWNLLHEKISLPSRLDLGWKLDHAVANTLPHICPKTPAPGRPSIPCCASSRPGKYIYIKLECLEMNSESCVYVSGGGGGAAVVQKNTNHLHDIALKFMYHCKSMYDGQSDLCVLRLRLTCTIQPFQEGGGEWNVGLAGDGRAPSGGGSRAPPPKDFSHFTDIFWI